MFLDIILLSFKQKEEASNIWHSVILCYNYKENVKMVLCIVCEIKREARNQAAWHTLAARPHITGGWHREQIHYRLNMYPYSANSDETETKTHNKPIRLYPFHGSSRWFYSTAGAEETILPRSVRGTAAECLRRNPSILLNVGQYNRNIISWFKSSYILIMIYHNMVT